MSRFTDYQKGLIITTLGVLTIVPDGLILRLIAADSWTVSFWRGLLIGISMTLFLIFYYRGEFFNNFKKMGWLGIIVSILTGASTFLFVFALTQTSVASALFIVSTSPVFSALFAWLFLKEIVPWRTWATVGVVLIGITIIAWGTPSGGNDRIGNLAALAIALILAINFSLIRYFNGADMLPAVAIGGFLSSLIAFPFAESLTLSGQQWGYMLVLGGLILPLAFSLMYIGPRYIPAPEVSLLLLLEAVFSPLLVWLVIGERPVMATLVGGAIIVTALAINSAIPFLNRGDAPPSIEKPSGA